MAKFYITTAIPYVNAKPHIGHILDFVQADVLARHHRQKGDEVLLLSGSDENALKNVQAAEQAGVPVQEFVDKNAEQFRKLGDALGAQLDVFQKGSSQQHHESTQKLWELCDKAGDIYKKTYEGLYCVGCETFYTKSELNRNQECFEHPGKKLEQVSEKNYFFRLSKYQDKLVELIEKDEFIQLTEKEELHILPTARKNEILSFLKQPLQDISISRSNERAKNWGVPVPGDDSQRIYVWFDALNIYQSGIGFGADEAKYKKWWPADLHIIGKGIIRFHTVYWPAFLLSAGLPLPKSIFVHGYVTSNGQKMSKSLGNVVDPFELVEKYGADAVRYFFLREIPSMEDGDFSYEKFEARYNADLAGGLGNLVARVLAVAEQAGVKTPSEFQNKDFPDLLVKKEQEVTGLLDGFQFSLALERIWEIIQFCDRYIEEKRPWSFDPTQDKEELEDVIGDLLLTISHIAKLLQPFLPETSEKIAQQIKEGKGESLFPRLR